MLESIRNFFSGWIAWLVIGVLVFVFAVWGIGNYFTGTGEIVVAEVGDEAITQQQFNERWLNYQAQMRQRFGEIYDSGLFDEDQLRRQVLEAMIDEQVLQQAAEDAGFGVSDDMLRQEITGFEAFQVAGDFNPELYRSQLSMAGLTPTGFEARLRADLRANQMRSLPAVTALASTQEIARYVALRDQERDFSFRVFAAEDFVEQVELEEGSVESYYEDNSDRFMKPAEAQVRYVQLTPSYVDEFIEIDDSLLRTRYEQSRAQFMSPEIRVASHILFEVFPDADDEQIEAKREAAESAYQRLQDGADFAELASEVSEDPGSADIGGDLGEVERGMMVDAFEQALYNLPEGEFSEPVQTEFGFHIILNRETIESEGQSFEEAREQLAEEARELERERAMLEQTDRLMTINFENEGSLDAVAEGMDLEVQSAGPITRQGTPDGLFADAEVLEAVFSEAVIGGMNSEPITLEDQSVVVVSVNQYAPEEVRPLDEVREQIVETLQREQAGALARAAAEAELESLGELSAEAPLAGLAGDDGEGVTQASAIKRNNTQQPRAVVRAAFRMSKPSEQQPVVADVVDAQGEDVAIVALTAVRDGRTEALSAAQLEDVRQELAESLVNVEGPALVANLRAKYSIVINEDELTPNILE
jgi:peptidyl-prolyl cis-trans isomerase D